MNAQLCVSWDSYSNHVSKGFASLQQNAEFVDMTLAADGHLVKVHQNVVALASPYLKAMLQSAACQHPVIFLDKINHNILVYVLEYIYTGEAKIPFNDINRFIEACQSLCIRGIETIAAPQILKRHPEVVTTEKPSQDNVTHLKLNTEGDTYNFDLITNDTISNNDQKPLPVEIMPQNDLHVTAVPDIPSQNDPTTAELEVPLVPLIPEQNNEQLPVLDQSNLEIPFFVIQNTTHSSGLPVQSNLPIELLPAAADSNINEQIEHSTANNHNIGTEIASENDVDMDDLNYFLKLKPSNTLSCKNTTINTNKTENPIKIISDITLNTKEDRKQSDTDATQLKKPLCLLINTNPWLSKPIANKTMLIKPVTSISNSINQSVHSKPSESSCSLTKKLKAVRIDKSKIGPKTCPDVTTENSPSLNKNNNSIGYETDINLSNEDQTNPNESSLQMEVESLMNDWPVPNLEEELEPIIIAQQHVPENPTNPIQNKADDAKTPQYSISPKGSLQLILNRFIYVDHQLSKCGYKRRWRCIDYRGLQCPAYVDTNNDEITVTSDQHNHYYHDNQISMKIMKNKLFPSITKATESMGKTKHPPKPKKKIHEEN